MDRKVVSAAVTPQEREALRRLAFERDTSISEIIRALLLGDKEVSARFSFLRDVDEQSSIQVEHS